MGQRLFLKSKDKLEFYLYAFNWITEVVYIGTLNPSHFELGKLMLNAGKHVLCEKPMTMNTKQTRELIELAKSKKLFLMEGIWSRCFPAYDTLRKELANKSIGEVKQVTVGFGFAGLSAIDRLKYALSSAFD